MAITLHIIFGLVAFVGSVFLATAFGEKFKELTGGQKAGVVLSYFGTMGSTVLGISSRFENLTWLILISVAILAFTTIAFFKKNRKMNQVIAEKMFNKGV